MSNSVVLPGESRPTRNFKSSRPTVTRPKEAASETQFELNLRKRNVGLKRESGIAFDVQSQSKRHFMEEEVPSDVRFASDDNSEAYEKINAFEELKRRQNKSLAAAKNLIYKPSLSHEHQTIQNEGSMASSGKWRQLFGSVGVNVNGSLSIVSQDEETRS